MKNFNKKRAVVLLTATALLLAAVVGGTVAYLVDRTGDVINTFNPTKADIIIEEKDPEGNDFDGTVKENVKIKNTGDLAVYVRAKIVVSWKVEVSEGVFETYGQLPVEGTDYTITWGKNTGWDMETSDDFYYYQTPVFKNAYTGILIDECKPVIDSDGNDTAPEGYHLHVEVLSQAIQAVPTTAVEQAWGVTVANDGTISK